MRLNFSKIFLLVMLIVVSACGNAEEKHGNILEQAFAVEGMDGRYHSELFKISFNKPNGWYVVSHEELNGIFNLGIDLLAGDDEPIRRLLESGKLKNIPIAAIYQYELGAAVEYNPSLLLIAEDVKLSPGVKTGADYFFHYKKLMSNNGFEAEVSNEYGKRMIGGKEFTSMDIMMNVAGVDVLQTIYVVRVGDYFYAVVKTYQEEGQSVALDEVLNSIQIDG